MIRIKQRFADVWLVSLEVGLLRLSLDSGESARLSAAQAAEILNLLESSPSTRGMYVITLAK